MSDTDLPQTRIAADAEDAAGKAAEVAKELKPSRLSRAERAKAAYRRIDISCIPAGEIRQEILDDASVGGRGTGLQVVELVINGGAEVPVYGVYGHNEELWKQTMAEYEFSENDTDEDALAAKAQADAEDEAARIREQEAKALEGIGKDNSAAAKTNAKK